MAIELITGYAGSGHISSSDAGRFNAGVCGTGKYVLGTGTKFAYTIESSNLVRIGSGDAVNQGRHIIIPQNSVEDATIQNGNQGKTRIDVIALRYSKNSSTGIESASLVVVKGTEVNSGSTPSVPSVTSGNIFNGALTDDMPLYQVRITGTQIESVTKVFKEVPSLATLADVVYPVGSIYMSVSNVNPANLFGGTWQELQGMFLLGRSSSHAAGTTGGEESHTLTAAEMPSHTHTGPSHTHTGPSHTHTGPSHTHTLASHSHTASTGSAGSHTHKINRAKIAATGTAKYAIQDESKNPDDTYKNTKSAGSHTHSVTVNESGNLTTEAAGTGVTGASGTGNTGASGTGATSSAGGGGAHNNMPPYLAVYMWKRTA